MPDAEFRADRTIVIEGPFQTDADRDDHWAQATIEAHGRQYRVAAVIPGQSDFHHFFGMTEEEREESRGWFALVELARCSHAAFEPGNSGYLPEVQVEIAQAPPLERWVIEDVLNYAHGQLRGYEVKREGSTWRAEPKARVQAQMAAGAPPQQPTQGRLREQPGLRPQPTSHGARRNEDRDLKLSRPVRIEYDRDEGLQPSVAAQPKKSGGLKTFLSSLAGILKNFRGV